MSERGQVLVAILNSPRDMVLARDQHWYRIPVSSVRKWLRARWPPKWLAFYQTKVFGSEAYAVHYYARVIDVRRVYRRELFPEEGDEERRRRRYYKIMLEPLQKLERPIQSRRWRRIVFVPTTWRKFVSAVEINDLYDESPLEDILWSGLKSWRIPAERQRLVTVNRENFFLDFAIYCGHGKLDVETDGDTWHANPERSGEDNLRDNSLKTVGWNVVRFNTQRIREEHTSYCLPTIAKVVNGLGGVADAAIVPRLVDPRLAEGVEQLGLFDNLGRDKAGPPEDGGAG